MQCNVRRFQLTGPSRSSPAKGEVMRLKKNAFRVVVLLLLLLPATAARAQSFSEAQLSAEGQKAYQALLTATRFEDVAIGYAGKRSKLVEAYNILLTEPAADASFKNLLERARLPGQLYALCGLYFTNHDFFRSVVEKYRKSEEEVDTLSGCIGGFRPVSSLIEAQKPIRIDTNNPEQSLTAHLETNTRELIDWNTRKKKRKGDKEPEGYQLDILNGGYSVWFKSARERSL